MQCNENKWSEKVAQKPKYVLESNPYQSFLNFFLVKCNGNLQKMQIPASSVLLSFRRLPTFKLSHAF